MIFLFLQSSNQIYDLHVCFVERRSISILTLNRLRGVHTDPMSKLDPYPGCFYNIWKKVMFERILAAFLLLLL